MPFPTAQQVNLPANPPYCPLMLRVKQASCEYQFQSHWFKPTRNQTRVYSYKGRRSYHSTICSVLGEMLCDHYLCSVEFNNQHIKEVRSKTQPKNSDTKATPSKSGFVLRRGGSRRGYVGDASLPPAVFNNALDE